MSEFLRRARVVAGAIPAWGAAITAVLGAVATHLVPLLPGPTGVQVAGWIAAVVAAVATVVKVVARVAQVPDDAVGLVLPEGQRLDMRLVDAASWPAGHVHPGSETFLRVDIPEESDPGKLAEAIRRTVGVDARVVIG